MTHNPTRSTGRAAGAALLAAGCLLVAGCTSSPEPTAPSASAPVGSTPAASAPATAAPATPDASGGASSAPADPGSAPDADALTIAIAITGDQVSPNGQKLDAQVGQKVDLIVSSDTDDEIHAHTGGDGYELEVKAGEATTGSFTLTTPGSFEIESHRLKKTIVILNAR